MPRLVLAHASALALAGYGARRHLAPPLAPRNRCCPVTGGRISADIQPVEVWTRTGDRALVAVATRAAAVWLGAAAPAVQALYALAAESDTMVRGDTLLPPLSRAETERIVRRG